MRVLGQITPSFHLFSQSMGVKSIKTCCSSWRWRKQNGFEIEEKPLTSKTATLQTWTLLRPTERLFSNAFVIYNKSHLLNGSSHSRHRKNSHSRQ